MEQREVRLRKVEKNVSQGQISLIFFFLINFKIILITHVICLFTNGGQKTTWKS